MTLPTSPPTPPEDRARTGRKRPRKVVLAVAALTALPLALGACGSTSKSAAGSTTTKSHTATSKPVSSIHIIIKDYAFHPADFTVSPGAKIIVTNEDPVTHTLTDMANSKIFNTGDIGTGQTKTITAPTKPGKYPYFCLIHNFMTGVLTVS